MRASGPPHNATVTVYDAEGSIIHRTRLVSGNMTPEEKAKGFPLNTLLAHTESRATRHIPLQPGQTMLIEGQYAPCSACKYAMRVASKGGGTYVYTWEGNMRVSVGGRVIRRR